MAHLKEMQPGGFFDITTIKGNLRGIVLGVICFLGMWYSHEIFLWIDSILEIEREYSSVNKVKFRRVMSVLLGGGTILVFFIYLLIVLFGKKKNI